MSKKILVVLTSVEKYPDLDRPTGLWLGEAVHFVHKVQAAGFKVDYVSPQGGYTPIDPHSLAADMAFAACLAGHIVSWDQLTGLLRDYWLASGDPHQSRL